jgi:hypothetical protein
VVVAERYADGLSDDLELNTAGRLVQQSIRTLPDDDAGLGPANAALLLTASASLFGPKCAWVIANQTASCIHRARREELRYQCSLLRDIVGNPFRPPILEYRASSSVAVEIARTIYNDRAFNRFPGLATALANAGYTDRMIVEHCQDRSPHVRGCWLIDLLLNLK